MKNHNIAGLTDAELAIAREGYADIVSPSLLRRAAPWLMTSLIIGYLAWLWVKFGLTPEILMKGATKLGTFIVAMLPPDPGPYAWEFLAATGETVGMAFLGTLFGALIAFPLAYCGASNVVRNPVIHFLVRRIFDIFRGIPSIIWALVFVASLGLGPMAGVLALMMSDFAALAKLGAEAIENADRKSVEGVTATGASRRAAQRSASNTCAPVSTSGWCFSGCGTPNSASTSGSTTRSAPQARSTSTNTSGRGSASARSVSFQTRSATSASASPAETMARISSRVSGATVKPSGAKRAAKRATRRMRTGSSTKAGPT